MGPRFAVAVYVLLGWPTILLHCFWGLWKCGAKKKKRTFKRTLQQGAVAEPWPTEGGHKICHLGNLQNEEKKAEAPE